MIALGVTLIVLLVIAIVVFVAQLLESRRGRGGVAERLRRTVVVHTRDGHSIRGVLLGEYDDCIVLSHVALLNGNQPTGLGGELIVLLSEISFLQDVTAIVELDQKGELGHLRAA